MQETHWCFISTQVSLPQIYFARQEIAIRADLSEDTLRYWLREGILRPDHGGGKGNHWRFSRFELGLAAILAELRALGLSSATLRELAACFHSAVDWMRAHRIDAQQAEEIDELVSLRRDIEGSAGSSAEQTSSERFEERLEQLMDDDMFDLSPRLVRLARTVNLLEWHTQHSFFRALVNVALERPTNSRPSFRLHRSDAGNWSIMTEDRQETFIELSINKVAWQLWAAER